MLSRACTRNMPTQAPLRSWMIWAVSFRSESITDMKLNKLVPKNFCSNVSKTESPGLNLLPSLISACPEGCFSHPWKSLFHTIRNMFHIWHTEHWPDPECRRCCICVYVYGWPCVCKTSVRGFLGFMEEWFSRGGWWQWCSTAAVSGLSFGDCTFSALHCVTDTKPLAERKLNSEWLGVTSKSEFLLWRHKPTHWTTWSQWPVA